MFWQRSLILYSDCDFGSGSVPPTGYAACSGGSSACSCMPGRHTRASSGRPCTLCACERIDAPSAVGCRSMHACRHAMNKSSQLRSSRQSATHPAVACRSIPRAAIYSTCSLLSRAGEAFPLPGRSPHPALHSHALPEALYLGRRYGLEDFLGCSERNSVFTNCRRK